MADAYEYKAGGDREKVPKLEAIVGDVLKAHRLVEDANGTVYRYTGTHWAEISIPSLRRLVFDVEHKTLSSSQRGEAIDLLRVSVHDSDLKWGNVADHEIPCRSGVLSVSGPKVTLRAHDPGDMLESVVPHPWEPDARCPVWDRFLDETLKGPGADEKYAALQEFFGYIALPHARLKTALLVYGPKSDTGKSVVVQVAQRLAGVEFCCSLPSRHMDDAQACAVLIGRRLNVMAELSAEDAMNDGFKRLVSSEDSIFVNPKYKPPFMYTPRAKHMISSNHLPRVDDQTDTVLNRLLIVPFDNVVPRDRQDPGLLKKLEAEMAGIFAWAVEGAERLVKNQGVFTAVAPAESLLAEMREENNPVAMFVKERLAPQDGAAIALKSLTAAVNEWNQGRKMSVRQVARACRAAGLAIRFWRLEGVPCKALPGYVFREAKPFAGPDGPLDADGRAVNRSGDA